MSEYVRPQASELLQRLQEPPRHMQVVVGPRQVGKTTMVLQAVRRSGLPSHVASADEPGLRGSAWLEQQWEVGRVAARSGGLDDPVLVLDEIQKLPGWSETVKRLWDEDVRNQRPLRVVILGSAELLIERGLSESIAGRFETIRLHQWSFGEMREAFGVTLDEYLAYGGYPGAASLRHDPDRWRRYIRDSLIETTIARDVLLLTRVDKPALLRRLFDLACRYSGQILSYTKMLGQLQDAGNSTTLAHYLDLLSGAGMVSGLQKYAGESVRARGSSPKLQVHDTGIMTAQLGIDLAGGRRDPEAWGRIVESAVGAHLVHAASTGALDLAYWRERDREVDFVVRGRRGVTVIEVKSSRARHSREGTDAFRARFGTARPLLVGGDGIPLGTFLSTDPRDMLD